MPDCLDIHGGCRLAAAQRVEADDYDAVDPVQCLIERRRCTIICDAFDLNGLVVRQCFGSLGEGLEIWFLDMIQKAGDALINLRSIRQLFEFWIKKGGAVRKPLESDHR